MKLWYGPGAVGLAVSGGLILGLLAEGAGDVLAAVLLLVPAGVVLFAWLRAWVRVLRGRHPDASVHPWEP